jgi:hypothetical protein
MQIEFETSLPWLPWSDSKIIFGGHAFYLDNEHETDGMRIELEQRVQV